MSNVRNLKIFSEVDPSHDAFKGFRASNDFYTCFCCNLLRNIVRRLPNLRRVEFDAWPSVRVDGQLMSALLREAKSAQLEITMAKDLALQRPTFSHTN